MKTDRLSLMTDDEVEQALDAQLVDVAGEQCNFMLFQPENCTEKQWQAALLKAGVECSESEAGGDPIQLLSDLETAQLELILEEAMTDSSVANREKFEAWAIKTGRVASGNFIMSKKFPGEYEDTLSEEAWEIWQAALRSSSPPAEGQSSKPACPACGVKVVSTAHGLYCPRETCKWGWEVEMDGSPLRPPAPTEAVATPEGQEGK